MDKIDEIYPVRVTYALTDIFNALDKSVRELEEKISLAKKGGQDMAWTISYNQSAADTRKTALGQVQQWLDDGVEFVETDAVFSENNLPRYIPSDSICAQISSGRLKPVEPSM